MPPNRHRFAIRTALRRVLMVAAFGGTIVGTYQGAIALMGRAKIPFAYPPLMRFSIDEKIGRLAPRTSASTPRIVFLGDSTVQGYPEGLDVATQFDRALEAQSPGAFDVISLATPGMGSLEYFFLAEPVYRTDPDAIVMAFNAFSLSDLARDHWARRDLVGWIPLSQLDETVMLPLAWWNITFDHTLTYIAMVQLDLPLFWLISRMTQKRAEKFVQHVRRRLQGIEDREAPSLPPPLPQIHPDYPMRLSRHAAIQMVGDAGVGAPMDHAVFEVLGAAIELFRERGIEVFVYATPINFEHLDRIGIDTQKGLATTVANARARVNAHGGHFLDLHRHVPDAGFRDWGNHLVYEGEFLGPQQVGAWVAEWYLAERPDDRPRGAN